MGDQLPNHPAGTDNIKTDKHGLKDHSGEGGVADFVRQLYAPRVSKADLATTQVGVSPGAQESTGKLDKSQALPTKGDESLAAKPTFKDGVLQGTEYQAQRNQLIDAIKQNEKDPAAVDKFVTNMQKFEERAKADKLSKQNVAETYSSMTKLLQTESKVPGITADKRKMLAEDFMADAAQPKPLTQGEHNTCSVAAIGKKMMITDPARAAGIDTTLALEGGYVASDGKYIQSYAESLSPFSEEVRHHDQGKGRSYAEQLLNIGLANDALQRRNPPMWYYQKEPENMLDTGERVILQSGRLLGRPMWDGSALPEDRPGLTDSEITEVMRRQTGDDQAVLASKSRVDERKKSDAARLPVPGLDMGHFRPDEINSIASEQELKSKLLELQQGNKLPAVVGVDYSNPALSGDSDKADDNANWHALLVTKIDEQTGQVEVVDSEPGYPSIRIMSVGTLFGAMNARKPNTD